MMDGIRYRHNIMNVNSVASFAGIRGGCRRGCRDVYFIRVLGVYKDLLSDIRHMDEQLSSGMKEGKLLYKRIEGLPRLSSADDAAFYAACYDKWISSGRKTVETRLHGSQKLKAALGAACETVSGRYMAYRGTASGSIKKNFIVKLLYWFDVLMDGFLVHWDERSCIKIVAANITKEQEYLFFYFLTLTGCDVMLLQSRADVEAAEELKKLSKELVLGSFGSEPIPACTAYIEAEAALDVSAQQACRSRPAAVPVPAVLSVRPDGAGRRVEKSFEELAALASSVVMISVHDRTGAVIGTGSGIMAGRNGYILTNHHVVRGGMYYSVIIENDENVYRTDEIIKYHSILDLALLRIDRKLQPIPIYNGEKKLARGQRVAAVGSPLGLFNSVSDGIISGFRTIDGVNMIQFTAPISHGSSGGAVLNMYGEVIGISTAGFDRGQNINLAVGYESIHPFIKGFV